MSEVILVRRPDIAFTEAEREAARRVLCGAIDGLGEKGKRQWRRLLNDLFALEPGECMTLHRHKQRSGPFHRRHMAMEQRIFEAQERFTNFDPGFRDWLKIGAGHCEWVPGPRGAIVPIPKSISYADMDEDEMREFHLAAIAFLREPYAQKVLWPKANDLQRDQAMRAILEEFGE
jgi:hypothetical protein